MRARTPERIARELVAEWIAETGVDCFGWQVADLVSRIETEIHFDRQRQATEQR